MRRIVVLASALLAACATAPAETPVHGETPGRAYQTPESGTFVGQPGNSETGAAILQASRAAVLRWAPPGYMLTMDYRADRVSVRLGPDYKITEISCG
jgi:hypothetical protein